MDKLVSDSWEKYVNSCGRGERFSSPGLACGLTILTHVRRVDTYRMQVPLLRPLNSQRDDAIVVHRSFSLNNGKCLTYVTRCITNTQPHVVLFLFVNARSSRELLLIFTTSCPLFSLLAAFFSCTCFSPHHPSCPHRFDVFQMLELDVIADRLIGSDEDGGLSLEQRKRTTLGVELAANPSLVFLDEPTSGLDARSAQVCSGVYGLLCVQL